MIRKACFIFSTSVLFFLATSITFSQISDKGQNNELQLRTLYGSTTTCDHITGDIFAVWWDKIMITWKAPKMF